MARNKCNIHLNTVLSYDQLRDCHEVERTHCSLVLQCPLEARGEMRHGILFGAGGGSHSGDLWSVRRQNFRSAFCSTRGEPLDRNNRHISRLLTKFATRSVYVGADRLKLRRTDVSPWMYAETFTFEWRKKNESVRPGLLLIASKLAHQLAGKPIEFLLEELRKRRKGELEIRTQTQTRLKHSPPFERNIRR